MKEEYLDNIVVDGLDETYATNMDVDDVVSPSVMLVDFAIDGSSSMNPYEKTMQDCLEHYKQAICNSKQADEMLVSKTVFNSTIETGGYVAPEDFNTDYSAYGCTKLYDTIIDRRQRLLNYMEQLKNNGTNTRACMVILTDGEDVGIFLLDCMDEFRQFPVSIPVMPKLLQEPFILLHLPGQSLPHFGRIESLCRNIHIVGGMVGGVEDDIVTRPIPQP